MQLPSLNTTRAGSLAARKAIMSSSAWGTAAALKCRQILCGQLGVARRTRIWAPAISNFLIMGCAAIPAWTLAQTGRPSALSLKAACAHNSSEPPHTALVIVDIKTIGLPILAALRVLEPACRPCSQCAVRREVARSKALKTDVVTAKAKA
jgi:hypothetical protein